MSAKTPSFRFNVKKAAKELLKDIEHERARDIVERRFGLRDNAQTIETLDTIGSTFGITRERVRQIENNTIKALRSSAAYKKLDTAFKELVRALDELGGVIAENEIGHRLTLKEGEDRNVLFLLSVGEPFYRFKENPEFVHHWYLDDAHARTAREGIRALYSKLGNNMVVPQDELLQEYRRALGTLPKGNAEDDILLRWVSISKKLDKNPLGEWGLSTSPNVRVRSMRDLAYLTLKRHGSPLHFAEVASKIESTFGKKAHRATTHNELIKDPRFVLVGRGLYALAEWGYTQGVVKDVIKSVLSNGPLTRRDIIERVKRERHVKDNTIVVNLQDTDMFIKNPDGTYAIR